MNITLTCFQGRAGDHNDLAIPGARAIAESLASIIDVTPVSIGHPEPALNTDWRTELSLCMPTLKIMQDHFDEICERKNLWQQISRCAVSLSTIPVVVKHNPEACIVWFDSHADLNTPSSSETGYLGGWHFLDPQVCVGSQVWVMARLLAQ